MNKSEAIKVLKSIYTDWLNKQNRDVLTEILVDDYENYLNAKDIEDLETIAALNYKLTLDIEE